MGVVPSYTSGQHESTWEESLTQILPATFEFLKVSKKKGLIIMTRFGNGEEIEFEMTKNKTDWEKRLEEFWNHANWEPQFDEVKQFISSELKRQKEEMVKKIEKEAIWEQNGKGFLMREDRWFKVKNHFRGGSKLVDTLQKEQ